MNTNTLHQEDDSLSALLDGELSDQAAHQIIHQLANDRARQARYSDYCAIGDFMRGHHDDLPDLTSKIMAALEDEPTVLAPVRKPPTRRPLLWLAAAACAAITWGLWGTAPRQENAVPLASLQTPTRAPVDVMPYLAAHQDYAQAVLTTPEMRFTPVSLSGDAQ